MRLLYVMLALLRDRLINKIKMEPRLSFEQRKARTKNVVEVQRQWRREYTTEPLMRLTIARIRDKFETRGTVCDVHKDRSGRSRISTSAASSAMVLKLFEHSLQKSGKHRRLGSAELVYVVLLKQKSSEFSFPRLLYALYEREPD